MSEKVKMVVVVGKWRKIVTEKVTLAIQTSEEALVVF